MSGIDRFRNRNVQNGPDGEPKWDSEKTITTFSHKQGSEEVSILEVHKGTGSYGLIRTAKIEGYTRKTSRWIAIASEHIEGVLNGIDQAGIRYSSVAGAPEEDLPAFPISCGDVGDINVKLDRFNGFFSVKITRRSGNEWAIIRPAEIEETIMALVKAYDHITGSSINEPNPVDIPF